VPNGMGDGEMSEVTQDTVGRAVMANVRLGAWMSAALDDPAVCDAMKADIREWFSAGEPVQMLSASTTALQAELAEARALLAEVHALFEDGVAGVDHRGFQQKGEAKRYTRVLLELRQALAGKETP
jgi:hypothetical protein